MRFVFRLLAMFSLAVAVIMTVVDATRTIAAAEWTFTPLGQSWHAVSPDTLEFVRAAIQRYALPVLWDPVMVFLLALPGWLIFAVLAFLFYAAGHRRHRRSELSPAR